MKSYFSISGLFILMSFLMCCNDNKKKGIEHQKDTISKAKSNASIILPAPYATKSTKKYSNVIGWTDGKTPIAPEGFIVEKYAEGLTNPRWIYEAPNGDILISEANTELSAKEKIAAKLSGKEESQNFGNSANRITLLRDADHDGIPEIKEVFLAGLKQPFGMLIMEGFFYVANTNAVLRYPYISGQTKITGKGTKILDLPEGGYNNHWTRNLIASKDSSKIYISVGSASNIGEHGMKEEERRANILQIDPDGSNEKIYASGLRNPIGMDWNPETNELWTAVNERDELGDNLVPDYVTSVKEGAFYGWPYSYFGPNIDPGFEGEKNPELIKKALVPDVALGAHTASMGLAFYNKSQFPDHYQNGAFVAQHGSWNRSELAGYKVIYLPFSNGKPTGKQEDFLTGFIADHEKGDVYGRPVCVTQIKDGSLLISDDASNTIWKVSKK